MNKKAGIIFASIVTVLVIVIVVGVVYQPKSDTTTPVNSGSSKTNGKTATITFTDSGFEPSSLTVASGTTIKVVNNSSKSVRFSSDNHPTHREDPELNMETLRPGETGSVVAQTVGTHSFHDHIDARKTGTLIVTQ